MSTSTSLPPEEASLDLPSRVLDGPLATRERLVEPSASLEQRDRPISPPDLASVRATAAVGDEPRRGGAEAASADGAGRPARGAAPERRPLPPEPTRSLAKAMRQAGVAVIDEEPCIVVDEITRLEGGYAYVVESGASRYDAVIGIGFSVKRTWRSDGTAPTQDERDDLIQRRLPLAEAAERNLATANRADEDRLEDVKFENTIEDEPGEGGSDELEVIKPDETPEPVEPAANGEASPRQLRAEAKNETDDVDGGDEAEPDDGASLLPEDGRAVLDGEVIPPGKDLFDEVNAAHDELMAGMRTTVEKAVALGRALTRAKEKCPHGSWLPWLERYTPIKRRSAAGYMALAAAWSTMRSRERQQLANLGVAGALAELSRRERECRALELERGRPHRRLKPAIKRVPEPAMEPVTTPATTEGQVTPEPEQQPESIPARDSDPAVEPAAEAEPPRGGAKAAQQTPVPRNKSSGVDLLSEITSLQRERDEGAIERSRGLASVDRRSARALELLDATIAAQARFLQGLRDLRERVRLEAGGSRP